MAEFRDRWAEFAAAGFSIAALSVDEPKRSAALVQQLGLPFPILCDPRRELVKSWKLLNNREMGGVAKPAIFVFGRDRRVLYRTIDQTHRRVSTGALLDFLKHGSAAAPAQPPRHRWVFAGLQEWFRALANLARYGGRSPED